MQSANEKHESSKRVSKGLKMTRGLMPSASVNVVNQSAFEKRTLLKRSEEGRK